MRSQDEKDEKLASARLDRRELLGAALATGMAAVPAAARNRAASVDGNLDRYIDTVVVIYAENRSFNNLFGDFPGVEQPLSGVAPDRSIPRARYGSVLEPLPPPSEERRVGQECVTTCSSRGAP